MIWCKTSPKQAQNKPKTSPKQAPPGVFSLVFVLFVVSYFDFVRASDSGRNEFRLPVEHISPLEGEHRSSSASSKLSFDSDDRFYAQNSGLRFRAKTGDTPCESYDTNSQGIIFESGDENEDDLDEEGLGEAKEPFVPGLKSNSVQGQRESLGAQGKEAGHKRHKISVPKFASSATSKAKDNPLSEGLEERVIASGCKSPLIPK